MFRKLVDMELSRSRQTVINIVAGVLNMLVTTAISFVLSPYIVATLGVEANGFVGLAHNFISYAALISTALNSMGSRFMMMAYYNNEQEKFRRYYSSLLFADMILAMVFGILGGLCVWKLEVLLDIPGDILGNVKLLFALIFANFVVTTATTVWAAAPFIKNRLYLNSINTTLSAVTRAMVILGLFLCLEPSVSFVGAATLISGSVTHLLQFLYKKALFPGLRARYADFSWGSILEVLSSGIWNTISNLGHILTSSIDLLVTNLFVNATAMGTLSVAHTMPTFVSTLNATIAGAFTPSLMIDYARGKTDELVKTIRQSAKIISVICSLPLGFLLVYGQEFYMLWQPTQDARVLHILSTIIIFGRVFFTGMQPLFDVFTVTNRVRENSIVTIATGLASVLLMYLMLMFTDLGVYAIASASVVCCFFKNVVFVIPFSAKYLGLKLTTFYGVLIPSLLCCCILVLWGMLQKLLFLPGSWLTLFASGVVFCGVGLCLTCFIVLNRQERAVLLQLVRSKLKR